MRATPPVPDWASSGVVGVSSLFMTKPCTNSPQRLHWPSGSFSRSEHAVVRVRFAHACGSSYSCPPAHVRAGIFLWQKKMT